MRDCHYPGTYATSLQPHKRFFTCSLSLLPASSYLAEPRAYSYLSASKACFIIASSFNLLSFTCGYLRSRECNKSMTAAATTMRVNHLLSAGTTYHGAAFVAVFRIVSSYAFM